MHLEAAAVLKNFANVTGKHLCWNLFFYQAESFQACSFIKKETPTQVFSCEICEIKNTHFEEHVRTTASVY